MIDPTFSFAQFRANRPRPQTESLNLSLAALQELATDDADDFWQMLVDVFNNLNQGLIVANRDGRVVVFNQVAQDIMGYEPEEVVGQAALWDFCEDCGDQPLFRGSLLRGESFPAEEVEMVRKDGTGRPIGVKITPLYGAGRVLIGALAILRSLDELRAQERERKNLVRMASIGLIISAVAHEINNPLQTVRTSIELGMDPRKNNARRQEYLQTADSEITRIAQVIGQMRDFYRPDFGEKKPTDVNATLEDALRLLTKKLQAAGIELQLNLSPALPQISLIDYQLQQVFLNLILNALEEMPDGGQLIISSSQDDQHNVVVFGIMRPLTIRHA